MIARRVPWMLATVCGVVLVILVGSPASSRAGAESSAEEPKLSDARACPDAPGFTCWHLAVPLDHERRLPGRLDLRVAGGRNADARRGVLLVLAGGPGQPGVAAVPRLAHALGPLLRDYRLVLYDQRGTGAGALVCPGLQAAMGGSDLYPPPARAVRSCAAGIGLRRRVYGTDDVIADMELLRRALGAEKWTLDGISYGSFVAERYALVHPRRVSRLVLDSVVPHAGRSDLGTAAMQATARVLRLVCRERSCDGDPARDLAALVRTRHDGPQLLEALTLISIVDPTFRQSFDVPALLHAARAGKPGELDRFLATVRGWAETPASGLSQGLHASALCADWRFAWGDSATPLAGRLPRLHAAAERLPGSAVWPFDRRTAVGNGIEQQCLPWAPTEPTPRPAARELPPVPTLLLAGDRDLSTPLAWARQEAAVAPRGRLVVVHGAGHSVQSRARSNAGRAAVRGFLGG